MDMNHDRRLEQYYQDPYATSTSSDATLKAMFSASGSRLCTIEEDRSVHCREASQVGPLHHHRHHLKEHPSDSSSSECDNTSTSESYYSDSPEPCDFLSGPCLLTLKYLCTEGDLQGVSRWLAEGMPPSGLVVPFFLACEGKNMEIVKLFIDQGVNVNATDAFGMSALHCAVWKGNPQLLELLLQHKGNPNLRNEEGKTPLYMACQQDDCMECARLLIEHAETDINLADNCHRTPLLEACVGKHHAKADYLLEHKADFTKADNAGETPIHVVCYHGWRDMLQCMMEKGANVNHQDDRGITPLHNAVSGGNPLLVSDLLESFGADSSLIDAGGKSALHWACGKGLADMVSILGRNNVDLNCRDVNGWSPLMYCAMYNQVDCARAILSDSRALLDQRNEDGETALHIAARKGYAEIVRIILQGKPNVNVRDSDGYSPLICCALYNQIECARVLLLSDAGIDLNLRENDGETALHFSCGRRQLEMARLLLEHNASVDCRDNDGYSPLMCVAFKDLVDEEGNDALQEAPTSAMEAIQLLVEFGATVNIQRPSDGMTVLQLAHDNNDKDMVEYLLAQGAKPSLAL